MYQLALIGYPIKHSLSPWIHTNFLEKAQLTGDYRIIEIKPEQSLAQQLDDIKQQSINGFNVTVPYKQKIIPYLDKLDDEAKHIGAVNTVIYKNDQLVGYNTDGIGYVRSLEQAFPSLERQKEQKRLLILGAGGAARGIYYALMQAGYRFIDIGNRTRSSAEDIATLKMMSVHTNIKTLTEAEEKLSEYDVIIQTTSVGMRPNEDHSIISLHQLKPQSIVSDIVYQPIETKFLTDAKSKGAYIHHGHTMLLYQAQYAFELWTNKRISLNDMDKQLKQILEES